jgi:hypothetical protein
VTYQNKSGSPATEARTVTFLVNDGSLDSSLLSRTITVKAKQASTRKAAIAAMIWGNGEALNRPASSQDKTRAADASFADLFL